MITDPFLYELGSSTMDPCSITKDAYDAARNSWLCTGCAAPKPGTGAIDVHLQRPPKQIAMNTVYGVGVGLLRRDLLSLLPAEAVQHDLLLGKVFDAESRELVEFATFRGRIRLAIRGDTRSSYRRCGVCGRHVYSPMGALYVLSTAPGDPQIYESQLQGLIVREQFLEGIRHRKWKELSIQKLSVEQAPKDGKPKFWGPEGIS